MHSWGVSGQHSPWHWSKEAEPIESTSVLLPVSESQKSINESGRRVYGYYYRISSSISFKDEAGKLVKWFEYSSIDHRPKDGKY